MTGLRRYHPLHAVGFLRKTLLLYLLPLVQVLFERDWDALRTALEQDLALFAFLTAVSGVILHASRWELDQEGALHLRWNLIVERRRLIRSRELAVVQIERPLLARLTGASLVTLYPAARGQGKTARLYLTRRDAALLADTLMPAPPEQEYHPRGGERLALVLLGANSLSTLLLVFLSLREGRVYTPSAELLALTQLSQTAAWVARWLPAGLAWLLTGLTVLFGLSLARSFGHTVHYRVWRGGGVLASRGGLFRRVERRFRLDRVSCADVRLSPVARLLRRYPVYLSAGCYKGTETPLFVYRAGQEKLLEELLPGLRIPPARRVPIGGRSLAFFLPAGIPCALFALLALVSRQVMPELTVLLALPALGFFAGVLAAVEGFFREGAWPSDGRLTFRRQKGLRMHCGCVFSPAPGLVMSQNPWAVVKRRADLTLVLPGGPRWNVRSIPLDDGERCAQFLEE